MMHIHLEGVYKYFSGFSGARSVYMNTSPAPKKCVKILLRRRKGVHAGEVFLYNFIYLSDTSPAPENSGKYLYRSTPFRRRRSICIQLPSAGEAGEIFIYTAFGGIVRISVCSSSSSSWGRP